MDVSVLGPLTVSADGGPLSPRDRVVLAVLAMTPRRAVSPDRLADALWGQDPPATWPKVVQGCVVRIRKALGPAAVRTTRHGYVLDLPEESVDTQRFEQLLHRARELLALHEPERARYTVEQALALWSGPALADLAGWAPGEAAARHWEELRRDAEELAVETSLQTGTGREMLAEAGRLVTEQPYRESRWALLARAQYQAGHQGDALATLRRCRVVLAEDLGLDPGEDLLRLEASILQQDPGLLPAPPDAAATTCPYPGLLFYDVDDSERYFGRDREVSTCLEVLGRAATLAVVGPSGSGKSSLVRAGVAASLVRAGRSLAVMTPGPHPLAALGRAGGLRPHAVLVVDQVEEVVTVCTDPDERAAFLDALAAVRAPGAEVVLALRADRLTDLSTHRPFARLLEEGLHLLGPMDEDDLRVAVEGPARQAGLLVEPGLTDLLVHEVSGEPGALPLLSHTLAQTWDQREGRTLTVEGYRASGGIQGAVAQTAERVFSGLDDDQQRAVRDLLLRLVLPQAGHEPAHHPLPRRIAAPDPAHAQVVEVLAAARLLTSDDEVVALAHESLARAWPRLRGWLEADAEGQLLLSHLSVAADSWQGMGRPDSELYRGERLARALEWRRTTTAQLSATEAAFLDASSALSEAESRAAEERLAVQTRTNRRLRALLTGVLVLLLVAVGAGGVALRESGRADEQARLASIRALSAASQAVQPEDPELAVLLALEATSPGATGAGAVPRLAVEALHAAVRSSRVVLVAEGVGGNVSWSGTGDLIATEGPEDTGLVDVRDPATGATVASFPGHDIDVNDVAFGPDELLATAGDDGALRVWEPGARDPVFELAGRGEAWGPSFAQRGPLRLAAAWPGGNRVRVATLATPGAAPAVREVRVPGRPHDTSLSPDGELVAVATLDGRRARVVRVGTGRTEYRLRGHDGPLEAVAWSPDGRWLATSGFQVVRVIDAATGRTRHTMTEAGSAVTALAWSPDSGRLASGGFDGQIRVHTLTRAGTHLSLSLAGTSTNAGVVGLAFSPDGSSLVSGDHLAARTAVWDVGSGGDAEVAHLATAPGEAGGLAYDRSGRLFTPGPGGSLLVWSDVTQDPGGRLEAPPRRARTGGRPGALTVSADGSTAASGHTRQGAVVWDVPSGRPLFTTPSGQWQARPALSRDGQLVALATDHHLELRSREGAELARLPAEPGFGFLDPVFGPDQRTVLAMHRPVQRNRPTDWELVTWDVDSGESQALPTEPGHRIAVAPDGRRVAVANPSGSSRVLDLPGGQVAFELEGHAAGVGDVVWSSDGHRLATAGLDGTAIVWDAADGTPTLRLPALDHELTDVALSPDGRHLATAGLGESFVRVWALELDELRRIAADRVSRGLSAAECAEHLPGRDCPTDPLG